MPILAGVSIRFHIYDQEKDFGTVVRVFVKNRPNLSPHTRCACATSRNTSLASDSRSLDRSNQAARGISDVSIGERLQVGHDPERAAMIHRDEAPGADASGRGPLAWSGRRESNPHCQLGKLMFCH